MFDCIFSLLRCPADLKASQAAEDTANKDLTHCKAALTTALEHNLDWQEMLGEVQAKLNAFDKADLPAIIRQLGPKVAASMNPAAYGRVWWECLKALGEQFRAPIEYVEWGPFEVWNQILAAYPNVRLRAGFRDEHYRVLTEPDMVIAIVDHTYVRWMEYALDWRDCTAIGERFRSHLNAEYEINACADVDGTLNGGSHNFNLVATVKGLMMVDVQSMARCAPVPPGLPGYIPTDVITL